MPNFSAILFIDHHCFRTCALSSNFRFERILFRRLFWHELDWPGSVLHTVIMLAHWITRNYGRGSVCALCLPSGEGFSKLPIRWKRRLIVIAPNLQHDGVWRTFTFLSTSTKRIPWGRCSSPPDDQPPYLRPLTPSSETYFCFGFFVAA